MKPFSIWRARRSQFAKYRVFGWALIALLQQRTGFIKKHKIEKILTGLKELRKITDQYVADKVLNAISSELTGDVLEWYNQIKTSGDPNVHFDGFDLERTQKGEIKARRVQVKAKSYDHELVSAVSSLSESKLNALEPIRKPLKLAVSNIRDCVKITH